MSNILDTLKQTVSKTAPLLGSAIGGPLGGIVGTLIASVLGVKTFDPKEILNIINSNSDAAIKLKQLEIDYQKTLVDAEVQNYKTQVDDTKDARAHFSHSRQQFFLAIMFLLFFASIVYLDGLKYMTVDPELRGILYACMMGLFGYYFGSSIKMALSK